MNYALFIFMIFASTAVFGQKNYVVAFFKVKAESSVTKEEKQILESTLAEQIQKLEQEGKLLVSGPFEGGGGFFILDSENVSAASNWVSDSKIKEAFVIELLPWTQRKGSICNMNGKSDYRKYSFVKYNTHITKFNIRQWPELLGEHHRFLKTLYKSHKVVANGDFSNQDGGILIIEGEIEKELIMSDPSVINGIMEPDFKTVWLAQNSFCE